jgi:hypothetical protein
LRSDTSRRRRCAQEGRRSRRDWSTTADDSAPCAQLVRGAARKFAVVVGGGADAVEASPRGDITNRRGWMATVYDIVTVTCFACVVLTYFMFTEGGMKVLAHFMLPAAAFAIANQLGNRGMDVPAVILIAAGIGYTYIIVRH